MQAHSDFSVVTSQAWATQSVFPRRGNDGEEDTPVSYRGYVQM